MKSLSDTLNWHTFLRMFSYYSKPYMVTVEILKTFIISNWECLFNYCFTKEYMEYKESGVGRGWRIYTLPTLLPYFSSYEFKITPWAKKCLIPFDSQCRQLLSSILISSRLIKVNFGVPQGDGAEHYKIYWIWIWLKFLSKLTKLIYLFENDFHIILSSIW